VIGSWWEALNSRERAQGTQREDEEKSRAKLGQFNRG
jgi:hypothetical protein